MSGYRGKKRAVVEVLSQARVGDENGRHYQCIVRLACGHVVKAVASNRCRKDARPTLGYCLECVVRDTEAA